MNATPSPTLLVNLDSGESNAALLRVAVDLAEHLGAGIIGVAARQPTPLDIYGTSYVSPEVINKDRDETAAEMQDAEAEFRAAFPSPTAEWRSSLTFALPADFIVNQARHADLLITGAPRRYTDRSRPAAGDLVMQCGRPVLVVPSASASAAVDRVMLAWRDTRESRRAALDALALLKLAVHVTVVEIAAADDMVAAEHRVADVSSWLAGHGVVAEALALTGIDDEARQLQSLAAETDTNLIVAGAYGHNRVREWAFGGVTRELIHDGRHCALLSH